MTVQAMNGITLEINQIGQAEILALFERLNNCTVEKHEIVSELYTFLKGNDQFHCFSVRQLQKLWVKLVKFYKIPYKKWACETNASTIHAYLFGNGEGYLSLLKFYKGRNMHLWYENAFIYGYMRVIQQENLTQFSLYYLTECICEPKYHVLLEGADAYTYFTQVCSSKTSEVFNSFKTLQLEQRQNNKKTLYNLLLKYNPHFKLEANATPKWFKELAQ